MKVMRYKDIYENSNQMLIYYRGEELISQEQYDRMRKLWGDTPYNYVEKHPIDNNTNTGLIEVTNILYTIWNDERLNERNKALESRIKKGITPSKSYYAGNVETNILEKIVKDAIDIFNKSSDEEMEYHNFPFKEMLRLYNLPIRKSVIADMDKEEAKIGDIPKPSKINDVKFKYNVSRDQCSSYKEYTVIGRLGFIDIPKYIYKKFPYLGKLYEVRGEGYIQIYVYDYADRDWALNNIINFLEDEFEIKLSK